MKRADRSGGPCSVASCDSPTEENHRRLCAQHWAEWLKSPEQLRYEQSRAPHASRVCFTDFVRRVEGEERNAPTGGAA